jgi:hypothetical protein
VAARDLRVVAHDGIDVAASVATEDGQPVLIVLRKGQTFESAVDALAKALPNEHPSTVNALVRQALPDAPLLRAELQEHSPVIVRPVPLVSPGRRFTVAAAVVTAVFTLVTYSYAARGAVSATRQPGPAPTVAAGAAAPDGVYEDVVRAAQLQCHRVTTVDAVCTDPSGRVVSAQAGVPLVTLDWAEDRIIVRAFGDTQEASNWARQRATVKMLRHVHSVGQYAVMGTNDRTMHAFIRRLAARLHGAPVTPPIEQ